MKSKANDRLLLGGRLEHSVPLLSNLPQLPLPPKCNPLRLPRGPRDRPRPPLGQVCWLGPGTGPLCLGAVLGLVGKAGDTPRAGAAPCPRRTDPPFPLSLRPAPCHPFRPQLITQVAPYRQRPSASTGSGIRFSDACGGSEGGSAWGPGDGDGDPLRGGERWGSRGTGRCTAKEGVGRGSVGGK